jgi:transposase-like protein
VLVKWRWPDGFVCPDCDGTAHCIVTRGARELFQCNACRKQTSVRAGTMFASSKLPLRLWFKAMYHLTQCIISRNPSRGCPHGPEVGLTGF